MCGVASACARASCTTGIVGRPSASGGFDAPGAHAENSANTAIVKAYRFMIGSLSLPIEPRRTVTRVAQAPLRQNAGAARERERSAAHSASARQRYQRSTISPPVSRAASSSQRCDAGLRIARGHDEHVRGARDGEQKGASTCNVVGGCGFTRFDVRMAKPIRIPFV